jgi:hypothetical protein
MNNQLIEEFYQFCKDHPYLRFWQALKEWAEVEKVLVKWPLCDEPDDTFNWEGKNE